MSSRNEEILKSCVEGGDCTFKPQSRIEALLFALKEKINAIGNGGGASGGGTVDGLVIKTITFTDRPSLYSWLQENYTKVLKAVGKISDLTMEYDTVFREHTDGAITFSGYFVTKNVDVFTIRISSATVTSNSASFVEGTTINTGAEETILTDEYWQLLGISIDIYYIAEGGGGAVGDPITVFVQDQDWCGPYEITYTNIRGEQVTEIVAAGANLYITAIAGSSISISGAYSGASVYVGDNQFSHYDFDKDAILLPASVQNCDLIIFG